MTDTLYLGSFFYFIERDPETGAFVISDKSDNVEQYIIENEILRQKDSQTEKLDDKGAI